MKSVLEQADSAVNEARRRTSDLLAVAEVPEGHPLEKKVTSAFIGLEEVLENIPTATREAARINDPGPVIYPVSGRDPRDWPTSEGRVASKILPLSSSTKARLAAMRGPIFVPESATGRRAITAREYLQALERATPTPSPITAQEDSESFTLVQIS